MCGIDSNIRFCTCSDHKSIEAFAEDSSGRTFLLWSLYKYLGNYESGLDGMLMPPQSGLNIGLNADFMLDNLNSDENLFDFNYTPNQGDNLIIKEFFVKGETSFKKLNRKLKGNDYISRMSFVFDKEVWTEDYYDPFIKKTEQFRQGALDFLLLGYQCFATLRFHSAAHNCIAS